MFGLFKKKSGPPSQDRVTTLTVKLCQINENLNSEITKLYEEFESYHPVELRFFTISAVSVFVQSFAKLPQDELHSLLENFTEQAIAVILFHMPKADYSMVHNAYVARFPAYPNLIVDVYNANEASTMEAATFALVYTMDQYIRVERGGFDVALAGLKVSAILTDLAVSVHRVMATG